MTCVHLHQSTHTYTCMHERGKEERKGKRKREERKRGLPVRRGREGGAGVEVIGEGDRRELHMWYTHA